MGKYASGKHSLAISDRSGMAFPYTEMVREWNGFLVHYSEYEPKQPQLEPKPVGSDPQALFNPRPQPSSKTSLILLDNNPFTSIIYGGTTYVNVFSEDHQRAAGSTVRFRGPPVVTSAGPGGTDEADLTNLQDDIRSYTEVSSTVLSSTVLDTIIKNSENKIYREVDSDQDRFYATSNAIVGNRYVTIPDDLRFIRYVQLKDQAGNQYYLEQRDTSFMAEYYSTPGTQAVDIPKYYANWDEEFWVLAPTPDKTYEITLAYNKQPETITDTTSTPAPATSGTYLSNNYQDLLLYASLVNTYGYLKGPQDMLQYYQGAYEKALYSYAIEQQGRRRRDEYADGVIRTVLQSENPSSNK
jgi:hypothetical protein